MKRGQKLRLEDDHVIADPDNNVQLRTSPDAAGFSFPRTSARIPESQHRSGAYGLESDNRNGLGPGSGCWNAGGGLLPGVAARSD
jgi:hypothetical protein